VKPRARGVRVEAHAKLNLGLAVGPARADGFHELATVFQSISLADSLVATPRRAGFTLAIRHEDASLVPRPAGRERIPVGRTNLVLRAAQLVAARCALPGGAAFRLTKRIPSQSGMGGGSADAAATIAALDALYGLRLSTPFRMKLAAELGSDVPFACLGGTALGLGRGERLERLTLAGAFRAVVIVPRWRVSTAEAFRQIDKNKYGLTAWATKLRYARNLRRGRLKPERALALGNTLEQALENRRSDLLSLRRRLVAAGVANARMTGSGSALFGILGPGLSARTVARRFAGSERIFTVRSTRVGWRLIRSTSLER
jgi:4-diphosphocytidyl-2-C-methyl-D-erythritol kinase